MEALFASGRIVDLILALVAAEAVLIVVWRRRTGRGLRLPDAVSLLLPGAFLFLALRAALTAAPWTTTALWLVGAFAAHLVDVARRVRAALRADDAQRRATLGRDG